MKETKQNDSLHVIVILKEYHYPINLYISLPVIPGFDHFDPGLYLQLDVQSKAQEEQHQKRKHHFVE